MFLYSLIFAALKTFEKLRKVIFMPGELFFSFSGTPIFEVGEQQYISFSHHWVGATWRSKQKGGEAHPPEAAL